MNHGASPVPPPGAVPRSALIVKLGALGDVLASMPFLHRLKAGWPGTRVSWAVEPRALALLQDHPLVDDLIVFERQRGLAGIARFARDLRGRRFDICIDLQRLTKSGLIALSSGAPRRLGFDRARTKELSDLFANERIAPASSTRPMVEQYLEFADHLGIPPADVEFPLPRSLADATGEAFDVLLGIGAGKPANRWSAASWAAVARRLAATGRSVCLVGGPGEARAAERILELVELPSCVGRTSLPQLAGMMRSSRLYVGLDSGTTHLACALGVPVVALYGAADERRTGPYGERARVVRRRPSCAPCGERHCPLGTIACMEELTPEEVLEAVEWSIAQRRAPGAGAPTASRT